jgi:hypothetical protein
MIILKNKNWLSYYSKFFEFENQVIPSNTIP